MQKDIVIHVLEKFCELSNYTFSPACFSSPESWLGQNRADFEEQLKNRASRAQIAFIGYELSETGLKNLLDQKEACAISYLSGDDLNPVIIGNKGGNLYLQPGDGGSLEYSTWSELKERLLKTEQNQYPVLSGFQLGTEESTEAEIKEMTPFKRLLGLLKTEKKDIYHIYFFALFIGLISLSLPLGIQAVVGLISGGLIIQSVVVLISFVVLATMISGWLQIRQIAAVELLQQRIFARTAFEYSFRLPRLKAEALHGQYGPELLNRFFDIVNLQKGLPKLLIDISAAMLQIFFGLLLLSFYHPLFIVLGIMLLVMMALVFYFSGPKGLKTSLYESKYKYKIAAWLQEVARSISTFKTGASGMAAERTDQHLYSYLRSRREHFNVLKKQYLAAIVFKTIITAALLILGSLLVVNRQINLGQFVASEIIIVLVLSSMEKFIFNLDVVYDILTAVEKLGHLSDIPLEKSTGIPLHKYQAPENFSVSVKDLGYQDLLTGKQLLSHINLEIKAGEKIALAGDIHSGREILLRILAAELQQYSGMLRLNNLSLKELNLPSYRQLIAENVSPQDVFEGSILDNIRLQHKNISVEQVVEHVQLTGFDAFLANEAAGLQTMVLNGGHNLDRYSREQIILCRTLLRPAALLLFQDVLYGFSSSCQENIFTRLSNPQSKHTLIASSNHPGLLSRCNRVVWMEQGSVKEVNSWEELRKNENFRQILSIQ